MTTAETDELKSGREARLNQRWHHLKKTPALHQLVAKQDEMGGVRNNVGRRGEQVAKNEELKSAFLCFSST